MDACAERLDKETRVINDNRLSVAINSVAIQDMLCIPINWSVERFKHTTMEDF